MQFFLSESDWDADAVTMRQIEVLRATPLTAPHAAGALILDETGDRKDGTHPAHVGYQYLGSIGKTANGIVAVSSLWADEQVYYPLQVRPYTPAARLAGGKQHPAFRTKPQLALELVQAARAAGIPFRAVVADSLYGEHPEFKRVMWESRLPSCSRSSPRKSSGPRLLSRNLLGRRRIGCAGERDERRRTIPERGRRSCGASTMDTRRPGGRSICGWAAMPRSIPPALVVATANPRTLPEASTWYLVTNLPLPGDNARRRAPRPARG